MNSYRCQCSAKKVHRLVFDGGSAVGQYEVNICNECYPKTTKKFLLEESTI